MEHRWLISIKKVCMLKMTVYRVSFWDIHLRTVGHFSGFMCTSVVDIDQKGMYVKNDCSLGEILGHPSAYGRTLFRIYVHIGG